MAGLGLALMLVRAAAAAPVVLISIDGLLPEYYLTPDEFGLQVPNLRALVAEAAYARGATSVMPSVTFPAHTTMITGVNPSRHGVVMNEVFDPDATLGGGWYWYYRDIKAPTLFGAARAAKLKTAAVTWPVTAGAPIDLNLPDMYPTPNLREAKNLLSLARTDAVEGLMAEVVPGPEALVRMKDDLRTTVAIRFLRERPDFLAVHFLELDSIQHEHGPRTPPTFETLERIDTQLGRLFEALRTDGRWDATTVVLVSDHGFVPIENDLRIGLLLKTLGLFETDARGKVLSWRAMAWPTGGTAAIFLHPDATDLDRRKVDDAVKLLLSNPAYGVARAYRPRDLAALGGFPGAHVVLETQPTFAFSSRLDATQLVGKSKGGTHGGSPLRPALRASFLMRGPKIRKGHDLGIVRLLDVAPTIARVLEVDLKNVEGRVLTEAFRTAGTPAAAAARKR